MLKKNETAVIRIEDMSKNGEGIGKADGFALFVKDTVPGDLAEVSVMKLKKSYGFARLVRVLEPSQDRVEAPCPAARQCGGCRLQMMTYEKQLQLKENIVKQALEHIGGFSGLDCMHPVTPADPYFRYRNKAVVPVGTGREGEPVAGFYAGHTHVIIPCEDCLLGPEENAEIIRMILEWMKRCHVPAYRESDGSGLIRQRQENTRPVRSSGIPGNSEDPGRGDSDQRSLLQRQYQKHERDLR